MDETTYTLLSQLPLPNVKLVALEDYLRSDPKLSTARKNRTYQEFCWTSSSNFSRYILKRNPKSKHIVYLDSDLYFFSSPQPIFDLWGNDSTLIIPHNIVPWKKDKEKFVGKYNVGLVGFKNDKDGLKALHWWSDSCIEWCHLRYEEGKFADQMYLDYFEEKFNKVHILNHKGANLAPWNLRQYQITKKGKQILVDEDELIFFHFQGLEIYRPVKFLPKTPIDSPYMVYSLPSQVKNMIVIPYFNTVQRMMDKVKQVSPSFDYGYIDRPPLLKQFYDIARLAKGYLNWKLG